MPIMNVDTQLTKIRLSRISMNPIDGTKVNFGLDADFREISRAAGKVKLRFILTVDTFPLVERASMEGFALLEEKVLQPDGDSGGADGVSLNELALAIFRNDFESLYLLFDTLKLPPPSPWMVREVRLVR